MKKIIKFIASFIASLIVVMVLFWFIGPLVGLFVSFVCWFDPRPLMLDLYKSCAPWKFIPGLMETWTEPGTIFALCILLLLVEFIRRNVFAFKGAASNKQHLNVL